jgi:hypothetical protein
MRILTWRYLPICIESQVLETNTGNWCTPVKSHLACTRRFNFTDDANIYVTDRETLIALSWGQIRSDLRPLRYIVVNVAPNCFPEDSYSVITPSVCSMISFSQNGCINKISKSMVDKLSEQLSSDVICDQRIMTCNYTVSSEQLFIPN